MENGIVLLHTSRRNGAPQSRDEYLAFTSRTVQNVISESHIARSQ